MYLAPLLAVNLNFGYYKESPEVNLDLNTVCSQLHRCSRGDAVDDWLGHSLPDDDGSLLWMDYFLNLATPSWILDCYSSQLVLNLHSGQWDFV